MHAALHDGPDDDRGEHRADERQQDRADRAEPLGEGGERPARVGVRDDRAEGQQLPGPGVGRA